MKRNTMPMAPNEQAGFSLVELLIAIVVTMIVTGAIYGLMLSGQNSFRRDPELTERQQNIRVAMDVIQRDVATAGMGIGTWIQAFTDGLDNQGPVPSVINGGGNADYLEIFGNDGLCPTMPTCGTPGGTAFFAMALPACLSQPGFLYLWGSAGPAQSAPGVPPGVVFSTPPGPGNNAACGGNSGHVDFQRGQAPDYNPPGGACNGGNANQAATNCENAAKIALVRYEISPDPNDPNIPCLWRSITGRGAYDGSSNNVAPPAGPPVGNWQMIARGIDDLQVQYMNGANPGIWTDTPGAVVQTNFNTIVQQVRVTLSARAFAIGLGGGAATSGGPPTRGQLTSVTTPRAAMFALSTNDPDGPNGPQLPPWQ